MNYQSLISPENLFRAFDEFKRGKRKKKDVAEFEYNLEEHIFQLSADLTAKTYSHGPYHRFHIHDPKFRIIHKAPVRDRVVHHVLYKYLCNLFDRTFIYHSYASRLGKGTHRGMKALHCMMRKASHNWKEPAYALKCDIRKFFANVDHGILLNFLSRKVTDQDILWLLREVIGSFTSHTHTHTSRTSARQCDFANFFEYLFEQVRSVCETSVASRMVRSLRR